MRNTLIYGCMFAGKTETLIKLYRKLESKGKKPFSIKHSIDTRYSSTNISSHSSHHIPARSYSKLMEIPEEKYANYEYILIDEGQFFEDLIEFVLLLQKKGKKWIIAGLNLDCHNQKFGHVLDVEPYAAVIINIKAVCATCSTNLATFTHKKINDDQLIAVGGAELYQPICLRCLGTTSLNNTNAQSV